MVYESTQNSPKKEMEKNKEQKHTQTPNVDVFITDGRVSRGNPRVQISFCSAKSTTKTYQRS